MSGRIIHGDATPEAWDNAAPARSPVDDALDRLDELVGALYDRKPIENEYRDALATVREVLERQREGQRLHSGEQARSADRLRAALERVEAAEAAVQRLSEELIEERDGREHFQRMHDGATTYYSWLKEGLREIEGLLKPIYAGPDSSGSNLAQAKLKVRALLAASPDGGGAK